MRYKLKQQVQQAPSSAQEALAPELSGLRAAVLTHSHAKRRSLSDSHELADRLQAERRIESAEEALVSE